MSRLLRTLQIEWEIVHQSVSVVTFTISDDLTDKIVIIYPENKVSVLIIWSLIFVNATTYNSFGGKKTFFTVFPLNVNLVIVLRPILHQPTLCTTFANDE